jgi:hypothetical protein
MRTRLIANNLRTVVVFIRSLPDIRFFGVEMLKITEYFPGYFYKKMGKAGKNPGNELVGIVQPRPLATGNLNNNF